MNSIEYYRTNYFRVKDMAAFEAWVARFYGQVRHHDKNPELVAVMDDSGEGIPSAYPDEAWTDNDEDMSFDFLADLSMHLHPGQVAIVMSSFHEGLRYVGGWAGAVNADGEHVEVGLDDIHQLAEKLGEAETRCEW